MKTKVGWLPSSLNSDEKSLMTVEQVGNLGTKDYYWLQKALLTKGSKK